MKKYFIGVVFLAIVIAAAYFYFALQTNELPTGWYSAGKGLDNYVYGIDYEVFHKGGASAFIKASSAEEGDFAAIYQSVSAENYLGKRVRLTGYMQVEETEGEAGVFLIIDGEDISKIGFEGLVERGATADAAWRSYEVVLDVRETSQRIRFGGALQGNGLARFDEFSLEIVSDQIPVSTEPVRKKIPSSPVNLVFEP